MSFPILILVSSAILFWIGPLDAFGKEYLIREGHQFADGTMNLNRWFMGRKLKFKAAFNESNIYKLPRGEQADSNKLFGFSDCKSTAVQSSARFGWRWFNNRLEITAVTHRDGDWHLHQIMGVAELNRVYDFEIELSEDKAFYHYKFDHGPAVRVLRDCMDESMFGYLLFPFFGGSEKSPQDMTVSVWDRPHANFVLEKVGPNPLIAGNPLSLQLRVGESMQVRFEIYTAVGQLAHSTQPIRFEALDDLQEYSLELPGNLSSGIYFIRPMAILTPEPLPGYVVGGGGNSYELIYLK
jgi:hypothetical protein